MHYSVEMFLDGGETKIKGTSEPLQQGGDHSGNSTESLRGGFGADIKQTDTDTANTGLSDVSAETNAKNRDDADGRDASKRGTKTSSNAKK